MICFTVISLASPERCTVNLTSDLPLTAASRSSLHLIFSPLILVITSAFSMPALKHKKLKSALQLLHLVRQYQVTRIIIAQNMFFCADCMHQQNDDENKEKRHVYEIKFMVIHVNMFYPSPELCLAVIHCRTHSFHGTVPFIEREYLPKKNL